MYNWQRSSEIGSFPVPYYDKRGRMADKTEAQIVYERIEELIAGGLSNAEAIRRVAEERGKKENAVRANQHQHRQKLQAGGAPSRATRRGRPGAKPQELTVEGALAQARAVLEKALAGIDGEVDAAKAELDSAQARYDELVAGVKARKAELERKIKALA